MEICAHLTIILQALHKAAPQITMSLPSDSAIVLGFGIYTIDKDGKLH